MRVVTEYNDKRVDIKLPISRHDSNPDTPAVLAKLLTEVLIVHGLQDELEVNKKCSRSRAAGSYPSIKNGNQCFHHTAWRR